MSDALGVWPVCTVRGCAHSIQWATRELRARAVDKHRADWIAPNGLAHCVCHAPDGFPVECFPCDQRHAHA